MNPDELYLRHILQAAKRITAYVSVGHERFMAETHWQDAAIRQLEIIGEATKRLSDEIRAQNSDVPWRRIAGLRDVLIHDYMGVDLNAVWQITQRDVPTLQKRVSQILAGLEGDS